MEKLFVYFKADDQQLVCCNPFRVSSKKVAYVEAHFDLGENWTGYDSVRAIWRNTQNFAIIGTVLDSQGICKVPTEVLTSIGQVDVNLVGSISENNVLTDRLTTYPVEAGQVDANALVDGSETTEITPSQFEQFAAAVRNDAERAREGAEAAESYADAAAESADDAAGSAQSAADDAARIAQMIQDVIDQIEDFYGVTVSVETLPAGSQATARYEEGHFYLGIPKGDKGDTGNGIASVTKTGTSGLVDTYTITFTNGQTTTFAVTNGEKGDTGNGIASITKTGTSGLVDTYTITYTDGQTETFTVTNGEKGDTGNGIDRIELTSTSGYVKTYTIYFTDGSTTTFEVTDGEVSLEDYYKQFIEDTASGSIASFPDGADDIPMISVLAEIDPVQDLHGYDKPWPAGGGENKSYVDDFETTLNGLTIKGENEVLTISGTSSGTISAAHTAWKNIKIKIPTDGTYFCARFFSGTLPSGVAFAYYDSQGNNIGISAQGNALTAGDYTIGVYAPSGSAFGTNFTIKFAVTPTSTATSWTPYSNECPIYGHTETDVTHTGKNLVDITNIENEGYYLTDGSFTTTNAYNCYKVECKPNTTYTSSGNFAGIRTYWKADGTFISGVNLGSGNVKTFTTPSDADYFKLSITKTAIDGTQQIELGSTATAYEPYQGNIYHVELEGHYTEVGTNNEPYLFRAVEDIAGDRLREKIVGGTVAWNQRFPTRTENYTGSNYTLSSNKDGKFVITVTATATEQGGPNHSNIGAGEFTANHVYAWLGSTKGIGIYLKYYGRNTDTIFKPAIASYNNITFKFSNLAVGTYEVYPQLFDLTQMFGPTIADYIYSLEQATAGAGVAWFRNLFPNEYYEYDSGSLKFVEGLQSHDTTGKNLLPQSEYITNPSGVTNKYVNESGKFTAGTTITLSGSAVDGTAVTASNTQIQFQLNGVSQLNLSPSMTTTLSHDIEYDGLLYYTNASLANKTVKLQLELSSIATEYEPYVKHSYPLDDSLTLRGIPKLADGKLYYDGDTYEADGTVTRKYGIVDLGSMTWAYNSSVKFFQASLSNIADVAYTAIPNIICSHYEAGSIASVRDGSMVGVSANISGYVYARDPNYTDAPSFKTAMSGVMLVYELATPVTESADPFEEIQKITSGGIEQYATESIVPVGHDTEYLSRVIYGGTVDIVSGVLTVDRGYAELSETWGWVKSGSYPGSYYAGAGILNPAISIGHPFMCSHARTALSINDYVMGTCYSDSALNFRIMSETSTLQDWKDYIVAQRTNGTPIAICYELAYPQTYQLTGQQINSLLGTNNVWADTGDVTVTYRADTKLYIDKALAS